MPSKGEEIEYAFSHNTLTLLQDRYILFFRIHIEVSHESYINLLSVVKTLLAPHGLGFGNALEELNLDLLDELNLEEEEVIIAADEVLSEGEIIKNLVKQMCA